ncbi:hypothetical protein [uncultured Nostoc sp.]|uniref:hypothetical protein n=1 Tax=uncultured Nostoc sp. TaxID=340711 RepID=UPI0035CB77B9
MYKGLHLAQQHKQLSPHLTTLNCEINGTVVKSDKARVKSASVAQTTGSGATSFKPLLKKAHFLALAANQD